MSATRAVSHMKPVVVLKNGRSGAGARRYVDALNAVNPDETDGLLIILNPQAMTDPSAVASALAENTHMARLARKLGFSVNRCSSGEYEMTIDLKNTYLNKDI